MAAWEDQGLFLALMINGIGSAVIIVIAFFLHKLKENARILRPNRPGSDRGTFFLPPNAAFVMRESAVLEQNGVRPMLYVMLLKFTFLLWVCMVLSSVAIITICATDTFVNVYRAEEDPEGCHKLDASDCGDSQFCTGTVLPGTGGNAFACIPAPRNGLFDFGVQNLTPDSWRWYLFGGVLALVLIPMILLVRSYASVLRGVIRFAHTAPAFKGLGFGGMVTVGARTVLVGGLPKDAACLSSPDEFMGYLSAETTAKKEILKKRLKKKEMIEALKKNVAAQQQQDGIVDREACKGNETGEASAPLSMNQETSAVTSPSGPSGKTDAEGEEGAAKSSRQQTLAEPFIVSNDHQVTPEPPLSAKEDSTTIAMRIRRRSSRGSRSSSCGAPRPWKRQDPLGPPIDLTMPSWAVANKCIVESSVILIQESPDGLLPLIAEEKEILTSLNQSIAAEKKEQDPEKKPVKKRIIPTVWKEVPAVEYDKEQLEKVREKMEPLLEERDTQGMAGAAFVTFDRASSAAAFVRQFNTEQGAVSSARAEVMGPRPNVVWTNVGVSAPQRTARLLVMAIVFTALVFGWSIPVGFFGNLENWRVIPGMRPIIDALPLFVSGALGSYLPVIVLTLFNIMLPALLKFFGVFGGVKTKDERHNSVLVMCAIFSVVTGLFMQALLLGGADRLNVVIDNPSQKNFFALILAIASPSTGYWFTFLVSAACIGMLLNLLHIGPLIKVKLLGRIADARQDSYDRLFDLREWDYPFITGRHIFFVAIGLVFHGTIPFVQPFALLYTGLAYFVQRAVILDAVMHDTRPIVNYRFVLTGAHCVLAMHTIASVLNVVVAGVRADLQTIGAPVLAFIGVVGSIYLHVHLHTVLRPIVVPSPEMIAAIEADADCLGLPREEFEDTMPYVPDYTTYEIDTEIVAKMEAEELKPVDKSWPKPGAELTFDEPATFLCFGAAAAKQQQVEHLYGRVDDLELENDRLRAFYNIAHDRANTLAAAGSQPVDPAHVAVTLAAVENRKGRKVSTV